MVMFTKNEMIAATLIIGGLIAIGVAVYIYKKRIQKFRGLDSDRNTTDPKLDDIALSPRYGMGEGTFGFGRFASTFMV